MRVRASHRARKLVALVVVGGAILLPACSASSPQSRAPAGDPISAARDLGDAPDSIRTKATVQLCGQFELTQEDNVPADAIACLDKAAAAGVQAELAWSYPTTEGDPIVYFASVAPWNENVVLYTTNWFDSYGGNYGWTTQSCSDASTAVNAYRVNECEDLVEG